jgi:hypothetical protein
MACGCGGLAVGDGSEVSVISERAIISHADGIEQIDLLLDLAADTGDTGLVLPTPTPATVTAGDRSDFDAVEAATTPRAEYVDDWWGFGDVGDGAGSAPEVVSTVVLGPIEATTLKASNTAGLNSWLAKNDYKISANSKKLLDFYVKKKWSFVAVKLVSDDVLEGELDPLRVTFESEKIVYPMRLSAAAKTPQSLRVYVLGDERMDVTQDTSTGAPLNAAVKTVWAGDVRDPALSSRGDYLTVIDLEWDDPRLQLTTDLAFVATPTADEIIPTVQVVRPIAILGIPVGIVVVGWAVVGLLMLFGALVARTRTR